PPHVALALPTICSPRRPTLLPYTTLFRSGIDILHLIGRLGAVVDGQTLFAGVIIRHQCPRLEGDPGVAAKMKHVLYHQVTLEPRDRKSTRLNSRHVKISYAVFCLKKKNTE